jgi:hypothetical protein
MAASTATVQVRSVTAPLPFNYWFEMIDGEMVMRISNLQGKMAFKLMIDGSVNVHQSRADVCLTGPDTVALTIEPRTLRGPDQRDDKYAVICNSANNTHHRLEHIAKLLKEEPDFSPHVTNRELNSLRDHAGNGPYAPGTYDLRRWVMTTWPNYMGNYGCGS